MVFDTTKQTIPTACCELLLLALITGALVLTVRLRWNHNGSLCRPSTSLSYRSTRGMCQARSCHGTTFEVPRFLQDSGLQDFGQSIRR